MRVVGLMCSKNECDVIEFVVRHHLDPHLGEPLVDELVVVDDSTDTTPEILQRLQAEGLQLTIWESGQPPEEYLRGGWPCDQFMHRLAAERDFEWLLHLDADEFLQCDRDTLERELGEVPAECSALVRWRTFVPRVGSCYYTLANPLCSMFEARAVETSSFTKSFVPHSIARDGRMAAGNHFCISNPRHKPIRPELAHVPVRNEEQLVIREILRCSGVNRHKFCAPQTEYQVNHYLRNHRFRLGDNELFERACRYNAPGAPLETTSEVPPMVSRDMTWRYKGLARQNIAETLERRIEQLVTALLAKGWQP